MSLDVKKQKAKKAWLFFKINCTEECTYDFFRCWNASSKVPPKYLELLKHQESYGSWFSRLSNIEKGTKHNFTDCKTRNKVRLMYLEAKLIEAKFN